MDEPFVSQTMAGARFSATRPLAETATRPPRKDSSGEIGRGEEVDSAKDPAADPAGDDGMSGGVETTGAGCGTTDSS